MTVRRWFFCLAATTALLGAFLRCAHAPRAPSTPAAKPGAVAPAPPASAALYNAVIVRPPGDSSALDATVKEAVETLRKMTGVAFSVRPSTTAPAISLVRTSDSGVPASDAERLAGKGPEAFILQASRAGGLRIVANTDAGIAYGLNEYLYQLGCRWLLPGEAWTVTPARRDITLNLDRLVVPAYRMRWIAGTGGFGPPTPVDPKGAVHRRWDEWMRHSRSIGEFVLRGHTGELFAIAHRKELALHPAYLSLIGGKRSEWSLGARLCVSNPDAVKLYVDDRLAELRRTGAFAVSAEPADGAGACGCDRCRAIGAGNEADQVFYLANQVAKAVAKEFPGHYVSVLAYSQHAEPPSIPIEPNVTVMVIPDAYQRTGMSSEELIAAWRKRVSRLSVYTYWSLPDWSADMPSFDWLDVPAQQARSWRAAGIEGASVQTSYGAGAVGPALYVASRLFWDPNEDEEALAEDFMRNAFGPAVAPMRRMLERWARGFTLSTYELGASYRDLTAARKLSSGSPETLRRIFDYALYLHYVRLWFEYQNGVGGAGPEGRRGRARAILSWLYRIHDTGLVSTYRMRDLLIERYERDPVLRTEFDANNPTAPGWTDAKVPLSDAGIDALLEEGARAYPPAAVESRSYSGKLVRAPVAPGQGAPPTLRALVLGGGTDIETEVRPGARLVFSINIRKNRFVAREALTVKAEDGNVVHRELLPADGETHTIDLGVPPGRYVCHVEDQKAMFTVGVPAGVPMTFRSFISADLSPRLFFWVPRGVRRIGLFVPSVFPVELFDGDGRRVPAEGKGLISAEVPEGQSGRAWSLQSYKAWEPIRMINLPQVFALSPDALLIPEDAAR